MTILANCNQNSHNLKPKSQETQQKPTKQLEKTFELT